MRLLNSLERLAVTINLTTENRRSLGEHMHNAVRYGNFLFPVQPRFRLKYPSPVDLGTYQNGYLCSGL